MRNGVVAVRIRRGDMIFHVHGEMAGKEGVWLAEGQVQGIYDSPVKTTYKTGAFQVGSKYKGKKRDHRDLILGFHIADTTNSYEFNESAFRQAFQYELDPWDVDHTPTWIEVDTELSGTRRLEVLMYEQPEFAAAIDPLQQQYGNLIMKLRAAQPDWFSDDWTDTFTSDATQATGTITVWNPTDQVAYQRLVLTRARWTIPDPQWVGGPAARTPGGVNADRVLDNLDITTVSGGAVLNWDRSELAFRDSNNTNLQARLGQRFLLYPIPPQTPPTPLPISYTGAPAGGAAARIEVPLRWSRPWGMELQETVNYTPPLGLTRFMQPGTWSYEIPPDCTHLDVVMLGGGGGGGASALGIDSEGGSAGSWSTTTLVRGGNLPEDTTVLHGQVGAGGAGGDKDFLHLYPGKDGEQTTCRGAGLATISAAGGIGSGHQNHWTGDDVSGPTITFNGIPYTGGKTQERRGQVGWAPGGGGAAGQLFSDGGAGARGQVWIRAYRQ